MKKFIRLLSVAVLVFQISNFASALAVIPLSDIAGHQYKTAIEYLYGKNIIGGYPDGTFKPDGQINRADLLKILVGGAGYVAPDATKYKNCFPDVKQEWFARYVCFAKEKGWVGGYNDGLFKPNQPAVKVEAMKMLLNSEGFIIPDMPIGNSIYSDVNFSEWYGSYMFVAEAMKIVNIAGAKYGPIGYVTRGEISDNIYRAMLILEQKVGSFDNVIITKGMGVKDPVVNPPVVNQQFDAPVLTVSSSNPSTVLLKWTTPAKTGDSDLKSYVQDYKLDTDVDYKSLNYSVNDYTTLVNDFGGVLLNSKASTTYNFRVRAVNVNGQSSSYSNVGTITTAQPLEPAAPTVEMVSQTFSSITLKVILPKYTGDSALDSIFSSFTDPNDGMSQSGSMSIAGNNIVDSWTVKYTFSPNKDSVTQPVYDFSFWVNNKNGKVSEKVVAKFSGLSTNPARPTVSVKAIGNNNIQFDVAPPDYTGSGSLTDYYYNLDSSSNPNDNFIDGGSYSKNYFENDLKGVLTVGNMLSPNTTYTISFWVVNANGKLSGKVTKMVTTSAN